MRGSCTSYFGQNQTFTRYGKPRRCTFPVAPGSATSNVYKNSLCTIHATLGLECESVKMPIQVVCDIVDFIVTPT